MSSGSTTFTLALAGIGFLITLIWAQPFMRILRRLKIAEKIQVVSPQGEFIRLGTLTMGGILFILPVGLLTVLLNAISLRGPSVLGLSILLPLAVMASFGVLGAVSDWRYVQDGLRGGLRARTKFLAQLALASLAAYGLHNVLDVPQLYLPFYKGEFEMGPWYFPFAVLVIVSAANGINLTGGISALSGLISGTAFAAYGAIALYQGQIFVARFCFTVTGALLGFLWYNIKPAALIMGNTGTFALGASLGVVALMTGQWAMLPLIAIIPVSEVVSVLVQVGYFRLTGGRRALKMAPLHYHFELSGWSETQIVQRFWLIDFLFAMLGITLALV